MLWEENNQWQGGVNENGNENKSGLLSNNSTILQQFGDANILTLHYITCNLADVLI